MKPELSTQKLIWVCKGHYNHDKHDSVYQAVQACIAEITGSNVEDIRLRSFIYWTTKCFEELNLCNHYPRILQECFKNAAFDSKQTISYEEILEQMFSVLALLRVRKDGEWIIDLSDLEGIKEIV